MPLHVLFADGEFGYGDLVEVAGFEPASRNAAARILRAQLAYDLGPPHPPASLSNAYTAHQTDFNEPTVSVSAPAGNYVVIGQATLMNHDDDWQTAVCSLQDGPLFFTRMPPKEDHFMPSEDRSRSLALRRSPPLGTSQSLAEEARSSAPLTCE